MSLSDWLQVAISLLTLAGVYGVFRYWQGKVDARLCSGDRKFNEIAEKCVKHTSMLDGLGRDVAGMHEEIRNHERRLNKVEDKVYK